MRDYAKSLLDGERVRLRALREEDLEVLEAWWNDPEWMVFQQGHIIPTPSPAAADMLRSWSGNKEATGAGLSVEEIEGEKLVGHIALWGVDPVVRAATLGVIIGGLHVGQGYGTDAVRVMLRYAFDELGLNKVELGVWEYNERARRAYEKVGFRVEGTRRAAAFHAGRYWAQIQMGILRDEFRQER